MIAAEFSGIQRVLQGKYKLCQSQEEAREWYMLLRGYEFDDVREALDDWIVNDGFTPAPVNILQRTKDIIRWREEAAVAPQISASNVRTVLCPECQDTGLVTWISPTGVRLGHPCKACPEGRKRFPWEFLTPEEKEEYNRKELRAGKRIPRPMEALRDFYLRYVYGDKGADAFGDGSSPDGDGFRPTDKGGELFGT